MSYQKRILLSGYYGFQNAGDEAVLAGLIKGFETVGAGQNLAISALSINPTLTESEHHIVAFHRYKIGALLRAIGSTDLFASGGGSLLQDVTSGHGILYYLGVVRAAQIMGKKTMLIAQGIGPLNLARSRKLTASVANRCDAITVRDPDSASLLRQIGVNKPEIVVTADPALLLGCEESIRKSGVGVSLRQTTNQFPAEIAEAVAGALYSVGQDRITPITMSPDDSEINYFAGFALDLLTGVKPRIDKPSALKYKEISKLVKSQELIIGMRLHSIILATANGVPSVALSYDPKVSAFMNQSSQSDMVFDTRDNDHDSLKKIISAAYAERHARAAKLTSILPKLRADALKNAEIALKLLP